MPVDPVALPIWAYPVLTAVGLLAGTLNVLAGGGSFLTLPVLIFLGLPAGVANGTNRVAIFCQNVGASWGFHRHGALDRRALFWAAAPATLGAAIGTGIALQIDDRSFQSVLAVLMVAVTLWSLRPRAREVTGDQVEGGSPPVHMAWLAVGFFVVGLYGGFVQAGVGFLVLAVTSLAGLDLVRGNAVKVLAILCFTTLSLALFAWQGRVLWAPGLALALGNFVGGLLGVRLTVLKGHAWLQRFVTATILIFAARLAWNALSAGGS